MGFFNGLMKGLGFDVEEQPKEKVKKQKKAKAYTGTGASFNFAESHTEIPDTEKVNAVKNESSAPTLAGFVIEQPKNQTDIQRLVQKAQSGQAVIVNISGFTATDRVRSLDFMAGAMFVLGGKIQTLDGNLYLLTIQ